jgi:hypothetical protein
MTIDRAKYGRVLAIGGCNAGPHWSAPLRTELAPARSCARLCTVELREVDGEWAFVGHWQDPKRSDVPPDDMRELFGYRFICWLGGSQAIITKEGEQPLFRSTKEAIDAGLMVERNRVTREALDDTFQQIHKLGLNGATESFALASAVVRGFLGEQWFDRHVMPNRR